MTVRLNRSTKGTLGKLNIWYPRFFDALALVQKGNLDCIEGRGVVALHRDWQEPWIEHQPRFIRSDCLLLRYAREQKVVRIYAFENPRQSGWCERGVDA